VFCTEHRQLPGVGSLIVADEISIAVCASQFEVPVIGRQPGVEHFHDGDATGTKNQRAWRLLAAMAGVALDINEQEPLLTHAITYDPWTDRKMRGRALRSDELGMRTHGALGTLTDSTCPTLRKPKGLQPCRHFARRNGDSQPAMVAGSRGRTKGEYDTLDRQKRRWQLLN
jgi:hypothetical protein